MASESLTLPARRRVRCPKCHQVLEITPHEFKHRGHDMQLFLACCPGKDYRAVASADRLNQAIAKAILKYLHRHAP